MSVNDSFASVASVPASLCATALHDILRILTTSDDITDEEAVTKNIEAAISRALQQACADAVAKERRATRDVIDEYAYDAAVAAHAVDTANALRTAALQRCLHALARMQQKRQLQRALHALHVHAVKQKHRDTLIASLSAHRERRVLQTAFSAWRTRAYRSALAKARHGQAARSTAGNSTGPAFSGADARALVSELKEQIHALQCQVQAMAAVRPAHMPSASPPGRAPPTATAAGQRAVAGHGEPTRAQQGVTAGHFPSAAPSPAAPATQGLLSPVDLAQQAADAVAGLRELLAASASTWAHGSGGQASQPAHGTPKKALPASAAVNTSTGSHASAVSTPSPRSTGGLPAPTTSTPGARPHPVPWQGLVSPLQGSEPIARELSFTGALPGSLDVSSIAAHHEDDHEDDHEECEEAEEEEGAGRGEIGAGGQGGKMQPPRADLRQSGQAHATGSTRAADPLAAQLLALDVTGDHASSLAALLPTDRGSAAARSPTDAQPARAALSSDDYDSLPASLLQELVEQQQQEEEADCPAAPAPTALTSNPWDTSSLPSVLRAQGTSPARTVRTRAKSGGKAHGSCGSAPGSSPVQPPTARVSPRARKPAVPVQQGRH